MVIIGFVPRVLMRFLRLMNNLQVIVVRNGKWMDSETLCMNAYIGLELRVVAHREQTSQKMHGLDMMVVMVWWQMHGYLGLEIWLKTVKNFEVQA